MHKVTTLLFLVFSSIYLNSQTKLDSLYAVWQDNTQTDSVRTEAFKNYIWDGFLFDKPNTAFTLAEELIIFSKSNQYRNAEAEAYNIQGVSFWLKANYFCKHLIGDYSIDTDIFEMRREYKMTPSTKRAK